MDIRKGSDAEFGQSIYEPFGIAQVEPLSFGAICVVSNVCGCCGFIHRATEGREVPNVVIADYTQLQIPPNSLEDVIHIGLTERNAIEVENSRDIAAKLLGRLPPQTSRCRGYDSRRLRHRFAHELGGRRRKLFLAWIETGVVTR